MDPAQVIVYVVCKIHVYMQRQSQVKLEMVSVVASIINADVECHVGGGNGAAPGDLPLHQGGGEFQPASHA